MLPSRDEILKHVIFKTSRSGGKGGQHVNKVSSKVEIIINLENTDIFTEEQKALLLTRLAPRLDNDGNLHIVSQEDRSQLLNKKRAISKLECLLAKSLQVQKKRKATKIPRSVIEKRLSTKLVNSSKKENRKKPDID